MTHLLTLANPALSPQVPAAAFLDCQLPPTSVDWSPLCPALISWLPFSWLLSPCDCLWDLPSLLLFRSRGRSRAQAILCVSRQNRQRDPLTGTHTHRNECHPSCHSALIRKIRRFISKLMLGSSQFVIFFFQNFVIFSIGTIHKSIELKSNEDISLNKTRSNHNTSFRNLKTTQAKLKNSLAEMKWANKNE